MLSDTEPQVIKDSEGKVEGIGSAVWIMVVTQIRQCLPILHNKAGIGLKNTRRKDCQSAVHFQ